MDKDKNKTKKGRGASTPDKPKPKPMVVTHQKVTNQMLYARVDEQEASGITPKIPTEVVSNPIDPGINPAKYIKPRTSLLKDQPKTPDTPKPKGARQTAAPPKTAKEVRDTPTEQKNIDFSRIEADFAYQAAEGTLSDSSATNPQLQEGGDMHRHQEQGRWLIGIACFLSILSLVLVGVLGIWIYSRTHQEIADVKQVISQEQSNVKALVEKAESSVATMKELEQKNQDYQADLKKLHTEIKGAQNQLILLSGKQGWVLNEAYYLVQNADVQLKLNQDIPTARAQLLLADEKIKALGHSQLSSVREALAKDIAALENTTLLDKHGVWAKLSAVESQLYHLRFKALVEENRSDSSKITESRSEGGASRWREGINNAWIEFKSLIRVSRYDQDVMQPVLTSLEQAQLLRTLTLITEEAKWAVLKGDSIVYRQSLNKLSQLIGQYFDTTPSREKLLSSIDELSRVSLLHAMPNIAGSLTALKNAIDGATSVDSRQETAS